MEITISGVDRLANYVGATCPVCQKEFLSGDDVVVCPVCGTPHHRSCYKQEGHCAVESRHAEGYAWQDPRSKKDPPKTEQGHAGVACPSCGARNPDDSLFCQVCGVRLKAASQEHAQGGTSGYYTNSASYAYSEAFGGIPPTEEICGVSARDLAFYTGARSAYFLPRFKLISEGIGISFNFPAFLFGSLYFFYRKMYAVGAFLLLIKILVFLPTLLIMPELAAFYAEHFQEILMGSNAYLSFQPEAHAWVLKILPVLRYVPFLLSLVFSLFANRLYLDFIVKRLHTIKSACDRMSTRGDSAGKERVYLEWISHEGRPSMLLPMVICFLFISVYFFLSYYYFAPYMDTIRQALFDVLANS